MTDKEQIIIDGKGCRYKTWEAECSLTGDHYGDNTEPCKFIDEKSCYFKQLARKTQEFEQLQEKYEALKLENEEGYEIVDELKQECEKLKAYAQQQENQREEYYKEYLKLSQECEELKSELHLYKTWYRAKHDDIKNYLGRCYKALERIKYEVTEEMKDLEADTNVYGCFMEILNIINKAKGR